MTSVLQFDMSMEIFWVLSEIFNESGDPIHKTCLSDLFMNQTDLFIKSTRWLDMIVSVNKALDGKRSVNNHIHFSLFITQSYKPYIMN